MVKDEDLSVVDISISEHRFRVTVTCLVRDYSVVKLKSRWSLA